MPTMRPGLIDSHCHLSDKKFSSDRGAVIARAHEAGVSHIVAVGGGGPIEDSEASADLARGNETIRATAGIHPHDAKDYDDAIEARIKVLLARPEVTAVGETGLDYYYDNSPRELQRQALARHLALAHSFDKPVVIHCREAETDFFEVFDSEFPDGHPGVMHCYTGGYQDARRALDRGLMISFSGILTFKNSKDLRDVAKKLPLDRLLVETDSPLLAPDPYRGKRNEPAYVVRVAEVLAGLHGVDLDVVSKSTSANTRVVFFPE